MHELEGQVAVITGGGQGIGREIGLVLAAAGATVVLTGRTVATLEEATSAVTAAGGTCRAIAADVAKETDCSMIVERTVAEFGRLDIFVNNAGIAGATKITTDMSLAEWHEVIDIDLTGAWLAARAAFPTMVAAGRGNVLNISSGAGRQGYPHRAPYAAAKWGLIGLTQTWAGEYGRNGIRVNCICPGAIEGDRIERVMRARAESMNLPYEQVKAGFVSTAAMARMATEAEVASTALFLCSRASGGVSGQTINVDCGSIMR
jgi:NAD(P)-dependent dehydrogenase (short-subunit alcohol dehydrogenase family)